MFPPFLVPAYDEDQEDSFFLVNLEKLSGSLAPFWNKRFMHNEVVFLTYCFSQLHGMIFKNMFLLFYGIYTYNDKISHILL